MIETQKAATRIEQGIGRLIKGIPDGYSASASMGYGETRVGTWYDKSEKTFTLSRASNGDVTIAKQYCYLAGADDKEVGRKKWSFQLAENGTLQKVTLETNYSYEQKEGKEQSHKTWDGKSISLWHKLRALAVSVEAEIYRDDKGFSLASAKLPKVP